MLSNDCEAFYEATVTTGLEWLAKEEAKEKLEINECTHQQGRIWFKTSKPLEHIVKLKSINNLFVIIHQIDLPELPTDSSSLEAMLMKVGDDCDWLTGITKWREISKFSSDIDKILTNNSEYKDKQPIFRVSSNHFGAKHQFTSPEICSTFGHVMDTKFGWPIKMRGYDLEVYCNINENHLYVGIVLTPTSLDRRNIIQTGISTLKSTTCYALLRIARIQCSDIVVDPMAGSGAIPIESGFAWDDEWKAYNVAGDLDQIALNKCRTNLTIFTSSKPPCDLMKLDVTNLPFRTNSIDVFVTDLPFGKRHGSKKHNRTLYPALLMDMARVARLGTARAVFLTQDAKGMNLAHKQCLEFWDEKCKHFVKIEPMESSFLMKQQGPASAEMSMLLIWPVSETS